VIIDAYNNAWEPVGTSDYLTGAEHTVHTMLASMDEAGVDRAVVCSLGQMIDNDFIARLALEYPERLIGFGQVNPRHPDAVADLYALGERKVLKGLKLHPTMHGYHFADHGLLDPIFAAARDTGLVLLVNALDDAFCGPFAIEEISRGFPEVPLLIAHMGTVWNTVEAMIVAERNPQILLETSSTSLLEVRTAYEKLGPSKIVMGTDWPDSDFDLERHKLRKAIADPADRALVEGANMAALLGLSG
jgi:predicted TIM-barrel fold metal-dependent hydrolase